MISNTYAIRASAQQFASVAVGMRQKANGMKQNATALMEKWRGKAADAYDSVSELLGNDMQTACTAFEQAANALHVLAGQLDEVNSLRQQVEQLNSQIQSLEWSLSGADDHDQASISSEISQLSYRRSSLQNEADSLEYKANATASAAFDDIAGMVNRLHFYHGTLAATSSNSSVLDKVDHFFSGLWHKTESAVEDAYQAVTNEFEKVGDQIEHALDDFQAKVEQGGWLGGTVGFFEGLTSSVIDTIKLAAEINPVNMIQNAILHPEATFEKANAIFNDLEHPVQTADRLWDGVKVLWSTAKQSFDQDIIHGNAYTRSIWAGYAVGVIAQTIATDGTAAAAKGVTIAGEGEEMAATEIGQAIVTNSKTCESIQRIIEKNGYDVEGFLKLLHPDKVLSDSEKHAVRLIRDQIGLPTKNEVMAKVFPQSDIYNYLYNPDKGIRGFSAVKEHSVNLKTLYDNYEGARLDYNNTAFKLTKGVDGISKSIGEPDKFFGVIEYKVKDPNKLSIPYREPKPDNYPYTGRGFTGSKEIVLPEYYQQERAFVKGDILKILDANSGEEVSVFVYDKSTWKQIK